MKLFVIILCLLSERFLMHSLSYKRFIWFEPYCQKLEDAVKGHQSWLLLALFVLPIVVPAAIIYYLFHSIFFGLIGFLFNLFLFFYCLGPQNPFYPISKQANESEKTSLLHYFAQVNSELFALIFWYIVAGPIVALFYRLISLCSNISSVSEEATRLRDVLEWIPARMTVLLYLLVGNFQRGFGLFRQYILAKPSMNNQMLGECGVQAVQENDKNHVSIIDGQQLVELATIVLLVGIALFTLVAWL